MDRQSLWFPLLLLAVLAALTTWLDFEVRNAMTEAIVRGRHAPDTILHDFATEQTDATGQLSYVLRAHRLSHFADDQSSELDRPVVVHLEPKGRTVTLTSKRGRASGDQKTVDFFDSVTVTRSDQKRSPMTLQTSYLRVLPDQRLAVTDKPVRITNGGTLVEGVGLHFDLRANTLSIKSKVRVTYLKNANPTPPAKAPLRPARRAR